MTDYYSFLLYRAYIMRWCYKCCWVDHWVYVRFMQNVVSELIDTAPNDEEERWWTEILSKIHN